MKIGVVGCGALGSFYGAKLLHAGEDVHFLLRSDFDVVRRDGVEIQSPDGNVRMRPPCAPRPESIGPCDLVVIGLKTTANDQFATLLPPLLREGTSILTLQNGLGNEAALAALFGPANILGGLCFICLNRLRPGVIQHIGYGQIVLGEFARASQPRTHSIAALFRKARISCEITEDLERARWEKLVWNIPFNGLGVASAAGYDAVIRGELTPGQSLGRCLPTDQLLSSPEWVQLIRELMNEVITTAQALGFNIPHELAETHIRRTYGMGHYKASSLIDFECGKPIELKHLFQLPLEQAQRSGVSTPRLSALCHVLNQLNPRGLGQP